MPTNQGPEFAAAEKAYLHAATPEDRIFYLKEMIKTSKKHKGTENLLKELKTRLKKLQQKQEKSKKSGKSKQGIRKEGFQIALIGLPNSGKTSLLSALTSIQDKSSPIPFSTKTPQLGMFKHLGVSAQLVDLPSIGSENFDQSITNTADLLLLVTEKISDLQKIKPFLQRASGKTFTLLTKSDLLSASQLRKLEENLKSKRLKGLVISSHNKYNLEKLKSFIISQMSVIRVYTKEPKKPASKLPVVLPKNSTIKDVAESILKGFSKTVKEIRITGPSSKFPNQTTSLKHICKDGDIVEFHTR